MAKILVIDDDPGKRSLVTRILERPEHEVVAAVDGARGVRLV